MAKPTKAVLKVLDELANLPPAPPAQDPLGPPLSALGPLTPLPPSTPTYVLGKRYNPKSERNTDTWNTIVLALADGPKTLSEIGSLVPGHKDFVGYMVRGHHIIPAPKHPLDPPLLAVTPVRITTAEIVKQFEELGVTGTGSK